MAESVYSYDLAMDDTSVYAPVKGSLTAIDKTTLEQKPLGTCSSTRGIAVGGGAVYWEEFGVTNWWVINKRAFEIVRASVYAA